MTTDNQQRPRLQRSSDNRMIGGICGGVAEFFGLDVSLVRLATLLLILFGGLSLWVYLLMWVIVPLGPSHPNYAK